MCNGNSTSSHDNLLCHQLAANLTRPTNLQVISPEYRHQVGISNFFGKVVEWDLTHSTNNSHRGPYQCSYQAERYPFNAANRNNLFLRTPTTMENRDGARETNSVHFSNRQAPNSPTKTTRLSAWGFSQINHFAGGLRQNERIRQRSTLDRGWLPIGHWIQISSACTTLDQTTTIKKSSQTKPNRNSHSIPACWQVVEGYRQAKCAIKDLRPRKHAQNPTEPIHSPTTANYRDKSDYNEEQRRRN